MGKTLSITIPELLEKDLQACADKAGISRSRFIGNILLKWREDREIRKESLSASMDLSAIEEGNICPNRDSDGFCNVFEIVCNAPESEIKTCTGYPKNEDK